MVLKHPWSDMTSGSQKNFDVPIGIRHQLQLEKASAGSNAPALLALLGVTPPFLVSWTRRGPFIFEIPMLHSSTVHA